MATVSFHRMLLVVLLALALVVGVLTPPARGQAAAGAECAVPLPIGEVTVGLTGSGLTVAKGNTPESFDAEVLGVLRDGIAPGVDMIIANLDSAAIAEAGIWFGMSGSPVYADDGRLIGAVSYSFSFERSSIAGLTPAGQMTKLYDYPGSTRSLSMEQDVQLPAAVRRRAAQASDATDRQLRGGMSPIPVPVGVSGLRRSRLPELEKRLEGTQDLKLYSAAAAERPKGDPADIFAGSNFVAALSYGDLTAAGSGTTTDVCDGMALAFGHPFIWEGRTAVSMHPAETIVIQPDGGFSFHIVNPGGVVGTVDQDRLTGVRARFSDGPDPTVASSDVASVTTGAERTGRTWINRDRDVPDLASFHLLTNLDTVFDKIGEGRTKLTWTATGTSGSGKPWKLRRTNRFANRFDASFESIFEMLEWLYILEDNRFTDVEFDHVQMTAKANESFQRLKLGTVRVAVNAGRYRKISAITRLRVRPGDVIKVRVPLKKFREDTAFRTVRLRLRVPRRLSGQSMRLAVLGGRSVAGETNPAAGTSLNDILDRMRRAESNNDVLARLQRNGGDAGPEVLRKAERALGNVVRGTRSVRVRVR